MVNNIIGTRASAYSKSRTSQYGRATAKMGPNYCRGLSHTHYTASPKSLVNGWPGPRETVGCLLRLDRMSLQPGWGMAYSIGNPWYLPTWEKLSSDVRSGRTGGDDDGDEKVNEHDEGDALFTWYANLFTTRNSVFTVEVIAELTKRPYHPGNAMPQHKAYKISSQDIHARKHLLAILDRTPTFKVQDDGSCDFTDPVKILMLRWAQTNK